MLITLENGNLCFTVDTLGAQMMSIVKGGTQYLWQGDPSYWSGRAPTLFPFIGRLWNKCYSYAGKVWDLDIHGFAKGKEFAVVEQSADCVVLSLSADADTRKRYPFDFNFEITYRLIKDTVEITYRVQNLGAETMPFGVGGHPGFNVPLQNGERFEDYYLEFTTACQPDRIGFTPAVYLSGTDERYPLEDDRIIRLKHALFEEDAIILKNMCREITLRSRVSGKYIRVSYPDMAYLGLWHMPKTDAPYVCIEPWSSLPGRQDVVEEFSCKSDLIHLQPGNTCQNTWTITIGD